MARQYSERVTRKEESDTCCRRGENFHGTRVMKKAVGRRVDETWRRRRARLASRCMRSTVKWESKEADTLGRLTNGLNQLCCKVYDVYALEDESSYVQRELESGWLGCHDK